MERANAAEWQAFFISCKGIVNTFVLGDPLAKTPRGSVSGASSVTISPANLIGSRSISTWGWTPSQTNIFRKMDYFQIPRNYISNPSALDQAPWESGDSTPTVTADFTTAPDGSATAERIVFPGSASRWMQDFSAAPGSVAGQQFTFIVWMKAGSSITARIRLRDVLADSSPADEESSYSNVSLTTSWQRFSVTRTMRLGVESAWAEITNLNDNSAKTVYAWGACVYSETQDARLYAVLSDTDSDSDGVAILDVFPPLRSEGADVEASPIITTNPVGLFRLSKNDFGWVENTNKHWTDMSFEAVESI
jgi:hypothetical protein